MEDLIHDLRYGFRALVQQPGFTAVAVFTIALGIAANTTIFSLVNGILFRPLPYHNPDEIVVVWPETYYSQRFFEIIEEAATSYQDLAGFAQRSGIIIDEDGARRIYGPRVTGRFFDVLQPDMAMGRTFADGEDRPGADEVMVISHSFWQQYFAGDAAAVGKDLRINGSPFTVVGVLDENFAFMSDELRLFVPIAFTEQQLSLNGRHSNNWQMLGRLKQ